MSRKTLNKSNLVTLGAEKLADLLLEAVKGDAARQRRVRMALSADLGAGDAAADIRKRFAAIRRARSYISWRSQRTLAKELNDIVALIETGIAADAPDTGFDLLWALLQLAPGLQERTDDSNGILGDVMDNAMEVIARIAPRLTLDPLALSDLVFDALQDNGYSEFDGAIPALAPALGETGLNRLKARATAVQSAPLEPGDVARYGFIDDPARQAELARKSRDQATDMMLQDIADQQGDVDAWLSRYTPEQLTFHTIAPDAAMRLLAAGRAQDALRVVENAKDSDKDGRQSWFDKPDLDEAHFACLEALGRDTDLMTALWARFRARLCPDTLHRYLKRLPDFEDDAALDQAKDVVMTHDSVTTALWFCLTRPDPALAAQVVLARLQDIDGNQYEVLTPLAEMLAPDHPLAAVLVWRSMIVFALERARTKRYGHAARHLASCAQTDMGIIDYGGYPDHAGFTKSLQQQHARKSAFWDRVHTA